MLHLDVAFRAACTGLVGLLTLYVSHLFSKRYLPIALAHRVMPCVVRLLLPLPSTHPISHRAAPHPVLRSITHHTRSSSLSVAPPMLRIVARPPRALSAADAAVLH
jgi:hypothetical protein